MLARIPIDNLQIIREKPCCVCYKPAPSEPHHWKTRGSGGSDLLTNLLPLCREHHIETHKIGRHTFYKKYEKKIKFSRDLHGLPELNRGVYEEKEDDKS